MILLDVVVVRDARRGMRGRGLFVLELFSAGLAEVDVDL